jgi:hypothetical protein
MDTVPSEAVTADGPIPVKSGDWVVSVHDPSRVAKVRAAYSFGGEILVDLYIYDRDGNRLGRTSPSMGGPRKFEPACTYKGAWRRISEPEFPIRVESVPDPDRPGWFRLIPYVKAERLEDRRLHEQKPYRPKLPSPSKLPSRSNEDDEVVASRLRYAAQELRDSVKNAGLEGQAAQSLLKRAQELEEEAEKFAPRIAAPVRRP